MMDEQRLVRGINIYRLPAEVYYFLSELESEFEYLLPDQLREQLHTILDKAEIDE